jgi:hypothetical protein
VTFDCLDGVAAGLRDRLTAAAAIEVDRFANKRCDFQTGDSYSCVTKCGSSMTAIEKPEFFSRMTSSIFLP